MRSKLQLVAAAGLLPIAAASAAGRSVSQPYRPLNEAAQWQIEGQRYGLMKVRVRINGETVADGSMIKADFATTYRERRVRTTCVVHQPFLGEHEYSCSVYVADELAANLVFGR